MAIAMICQVSMTAQFYNYRTHIVDNITYEIRYNGAHVVENQTVGGDITIPETVSIKGKSYKVTSIAKEAFKGNELITSVTLPSTITSIGDGSFRLCKNLKKTNIPDGVRSVGRMAYAQTGLPADKDGMLYIDHWLVGTGYSEIDNPDGSGLKKWEQHKPNGDLAVKEGTIGIALGTFDFCRELTKVVIPASVKYIGFPCFLGCDNLSGLEVKPGNKRYNSRNNCNAIIRGTTLIAGCSNTVIPDGIETIASEAFFSCRALTSIAIPEGVKVIGTSAFEKCANLKQINIPQSVSRIGKNAFYGTLWWREQPKGVVYKDGWLLGAKVPRPKGALTVQPGTKYIADAALQKSEELKEVILPDGLLGIAPSAFQGCSSLKKINFPQGLQTIGTAAFWGCTALKDIHLPASVIDINKSSFGNTAWYEKQSDGIIYLEGWLLGYKTKKPSKTLTVKEGTQHIAAEAFFGCADLTEVSFPNSLKTIEDYAFRYCSKLASAVLPEGLEKLGSYVFAYCSKLNEPNIPSSVTSVGTYCFIGTGWYESQPDNDFLYLDNWLLDYKGECQETEVEVQNGTKGIAGYAFYNTDNITAITLPSTLRRVGTEAFSECDGLIEVRINDLDAWKQIKFESTTSDPTFHTKSLTVNGQTITSW